MQTKVIKIDPTNIDAGAIAEAANLIDAGGLVAFPTETVYGIACRTRADSISKLNRLKGRAPEKPYTLHIGRKEDVAEYVPAMCLRARKLVDNGWPGPLTIVFQLNDEQIRTQRKKLAAEVFENLYKDNYIGIRLPDDAVAVQLLQTVKHPVVAPSVNFADQPPATETSQILAKFDGRLEMVLDSGPSRYKNSSTVVKIGPYDLQILRQGVYTAEQIGNMSNVQILFICSGNTCRSPIAVGMARKYITEKTGWPVDQIEEKGYKIISAGTIGIVGMAATAQAIAVCEAKGIDIKSHRSSAVSQSLIEQSDLIFVMTRTHLGQILAICPDAANNCMLLAEDEDIPDPVGQSVEIYVNTAKIIAEAVKKRFDELIL